MKNTIEELKNVKIEVRCEDPKHVSILHVVHAMNDAHYGRDAIISDKYHSGAPDDGATIDVTDVDNYLDALMKLSDVLGMTPNNLLYQMPITLIDVGGTDECRWLKMDQIIWTIYSIEELKTLNSSFWIDVEFIAAPSITGDDKRYRFTNRYQTLQNFKDKVADSPAEFALRYNKIMSGFFKYQQIKRCNKLMDLADVEIFVEAGKYNIYALDSYIAWEVFYLNKIIPRINADVVDKRNLSFIDHCIEIEESRDYSILEIIKMIDVNDYSSIANYLHDDYGYSLLEFISDLEKATKERQ